MPAGRPKHKSPDELKRAVRRMSACGISQEDIARVIGIDPTTLRTHYEEELANAQAEANTEVADSLFEMATKGKNVAAAIFWLKTRARWAEAKPERDPNEEATTLNVVISGGLPDPK